jgi:hypothetical protein
VRAALPRKTTRITTGTITISPANGNSVSLDVLPTVGAQKAINGAVMKCQVILQ